MSSVTHGFIACVLALTRITKPNFQSFRTGIFAFCSYCLRGKRPIGWEPVLAALQAGNKRYPGTARFWMGRGLTTSMWPYREAWVLERTRVITHLVRELQSQGSPTRVIRPCKLQEICINTWKWIDSAQAMEYFCYPWSNCLQPK